MKRAFSLIELIIVIIVIGILYSSVNYSLANTSLNQAADQLIYHINYTRHLAINDNKIQYYPINSSEIEMNRSKYWFKQWWQIRFTQNKNDPKDLWYEIFSDQPTDDNSTFDGLGNNPHNKSVWNVGYAINPLNHKYLVGKCDDNNHNYPKCDEYEASLNLTQKYNIEKIFFNGEEVSNNESKRLLFDNFGNIYLSEGKKGDGGDINPYDIDERIPLLKTAKIILCQDNNCENNISICITPKIGTVYICK